MDGILVQDSDWSRKLASGLYDLLKKKILCDLGIVCSAQNDVTSIKSHEVVMVHRCVLSAASETIKHLSVGAQVYNLVKINGVNISIECWNNVLEFVYSGHTIVHGSQLCDIRRAAHVLQIRELERVVDIHHMGHPLCVCPNRDPIVNSVSLSASTSDTYIIASDKWITQLFENMLDLLVKQTLCNMTIITEKADKTSAEILAHLCMLVAASNTIRELVLQGSETYNSVKIDSIAYNTWLYLLEYVYTSRVSIVKSNIPEVWVASQLLQIDGLANAVSSFATQITNSQSLTSTLGSPSPSQALEQSLSSQNKAVAGVPSADSSVGTTQDILDIKTELHGEKEDAHFNDATLPALADNDDNSITLSLNSDSCDIQSTSALNPITNLGTLTNDQTTSEHSLNDDNSVPGDIKYELQADSLPSFTNSDSEPQLGSLQTASSTSSAVGTSSTASSAPTQVLLTGAVAGSASQLLQGAQLIPVQTAVGGLAVQAAPQLGNVGQWLQTMGLDGATPTMLWLPQGVIPVVAPTQAPAQTLLTPSVLNAAATSPEKKTTSVTDVIDTSPTSSGDVITSGGDVSPKSGTKNLLCYCRKCEKVFSQSSAAEKHKCTGVLQSEAVSTTARTSGRGSMDINKLQCKHCLKIFSRTWTLNVHMRTHTGERPYKCVVCDKAFSDKSNMRQHMLIHTQDKQYKCPNCNQSFAQKRYMKKHFIETCRRKVTDPEAVLAAVKNIEGVEVIENCLRRDDKVNAEKNGMVIFMDRSLTLAKTIKTEKLLSPGSSSEVSSSTAVETPKKWDTSVIMAGDDVNMTPHDVTLSHDESEEETAQFEEDVPEDPLMCMLCKRHFKTERQKNSHRCLNL